MEPSKTEETSAIATVQSTNEEEFVGNFEVIFSIINNDCVDPTITVTYEEIDYSSSATEYFNVIDNDGTTITHCIGDEDRNCNIWETCIDDASLGVNTINAGTSYTITIATGPGFNDLCNPTHDLAFNARVELTCAGTPMSLENIFICIILYFFLFVISYTPLHKIKK